MDMAKVIKCVMNACQRHKCDTALPIHFTGGAASTLAH